MTKFFAHMHIGHSTEFVGDSWMDGGFSVDAEGNPTTDHNGNSVANYSVTEVEPDDWQSLRDAYAGEGDTVGDRDQFLVWLEEQGIDADDRVRVAREVEEELTERCAYCDRDIPYRNPELGQPSDSDDEAWDELAENHDEDCEWVCTRAHQVEQVVE